MIQIYGAIFEKVVLQQPLPIARYKFSRQKLVLG